MNADDLADVLSKIGYAISVVVGNMATFFLGPLPKFLLRLGIPYLIIFAVLLITSIIFSLTGFIVMINPLSVIIAIAIIALLLLMAFSMKKGGQNYDTNE